MTAGAHGKVGTVPQKFLADDLTLFQSGWGADYAHHIGLSPTKSFDIPAALLTPHFQANQRSVINNALEVSTHCSKVKNYKQ